MMRCLVQGLQESSVNGEPASWLQDAVNFLRGGRGVDQMFENIEGKNTIEDFIAKRKVMCISHDIGVPKNLVLELDAVRVALGRSARADMKNEVIPLPENLLVLSADRVAGVFPRHFYLLGDENRHALLGPKFGAALGALNRKWAGIEGRATPRAGED